MKSFTLILFYIFLLFNSISTYSQPANVPAEVEFKSLLSQSNIYMLKGEDQKAISCLLNCLKLNPKSSVANFQLSRLYLEHEDYDASLHFAKAAYNLNPNNYWYKVFLAVIYQTINDYDNAEKFYISSFPENASYDQYLKQAQTFIQIHKLESAISTLNKLESIFGYDSKVGLLKCQIFDLKNDFSSEESELNRLISLDSENSNYQILLADFYDSHNKHSEALRVREQISKKDPENSLSKLYQADLCRTNRQMDCFYKNLIESFSKLEELPLESKIDYLINFLETEKDIDVDKISEVLKILCDQYPNEKRVFNGYVNFLFQYRRYEQAEPIIKKALELDASNYKNWTNLLFLYTMTDEYEKLLEATEEAQSYYPELVELMGFHAIADTYLGNIQEADDNFAMVEATLDHFSHYYLFFKFYRGVYDYFTGNQNQGMNIMRQSYKDRFLFQDDFSHILLQIAYFCIDSNLIGDAEILINEFSEHFDLNYYFYFVRSFYGLKKGFLDKAVSDIEMALKLDNSKYFVLNMAGDIYFAVNEKAKAKEFWNQAIDRGGNPKVIKQKINKCN